MNRAMPLLRRYGAEGWSAYIQCLPPFISCNAQLQVGMCRYNYHLQTQVVLDCSCNWQQEHTLSVVTYPSSFLSSVDTNLLAN